MAGAILKQRIPGVELAEEAEDGDSKKPGKGRDLLWKELSRDTSKWLDSCKSPRYPNLKRRVKEAPLWLDSRDTRSWVIEELGSIAEPCHGAAVSGDACQSKAQVDAFVASLRACTRNNDLVRGTSIHNDLVQMGLLQSCSNALVIMYAKCGALGKAQEILDLHKSICDVVTWTALIAAYAREGQGQKALDCFEQMQHEGILPDAVTYACNLKACAKIGAGAAKKGKQFHDEIVQQGLLQKDIVLGYALVDMYVKCGAVSKARQVLEGLPSRDVISWSALIAGYTQEGDVEQALKCFEEMQGEGILPNAVTYACILKAYATIGAADKGEQIHDEITKQGLLLNDIVLGGALVDMYVKCGAVSKARQVLDGLAYRDVISWSSLIAGYTQEGDAEQALNCFEEMQCEGILPNAVTCACVLNVCSHRGLLEEGQSLFVNMTSKYGVTPDLDCYTCMVDLFGRAGHLDKAVRLIQDMPSSDYTIIWCSLLSSCWKWADVNVGRWAFEQAVKLEKSDESPYVLMANIYVRAGMGQKAGNIEAMRILNRAWKKPRHSRRSDSSDVNDEFSVGFRKHAEQLHQFNARRYFQ